MFAPPPRGRFLKQTSLLTIGTFIFFLFFYGMPVANVVLATYYAGGTAFVQGHDPYQATMTKGTGNQFKYSPLFALGMAGMAKVKAQEFAVGTWIFLSMAAFFAGVSRWVDLRGKVPLWMTLAVIACLLELTFSLILTQANALVIGLLLIGLAEYRDGRHFSAAAPIMLATNLKVYPVVFLIGLATRLRAAYWVGALVAGLFVFLLPACFVGWSQNLQTHFAWYHTVVGDAGAAGIIDLYSAFERIGLGALGRFLRGLVLTLTIPLFFGYIWRAKELEWRVWLTFGIAALLLLSPRTESFTYVLLAPSYLLMAAWCLESESTNVRRYGSLLCVTLAFLITSCQFTSSQWLVSFAPIEICRVFGALGFWMVSAIILFERCFRLRNRVSPLTGAHSA